MMLLALVVAATAVAAVPVERTNGVLGTVYRDDFELSNNQHHFVAFNRGCPGCRGGLVPHPFAYRYPYHLSDAYEERGLVKRSPEKFSFKKFSKKSFFGVKKGGKKSKKGFKKTKVPPFNKPFKGAKGFGKKNLGKSFKPGTPQNKGKKFGKKNLAKAGKPGTPQNKKAKGKGKKGGKKAKKGGKKGTKGFSKAAKKSSPVSVPALGLGGGGGGGALAFGVPGTGFAGFAVPGFADYVTG